jgi:hypothetical protein
VSEGYDIELVSVNLPVTTTITNINTFPSSCTYDFGTAIPIEYTIRNNSIFPVTSFRFTCEVYQGNNLVRTEVHTYNNPAFPLLPGATREISPYQYITGLPLGMYHIRSKVELINPNNEESIYENNH